jgi:phenylacetate-CoA ligase
MDLPSLLRLLRSRRALRRRDAWSRAELASYQAGALAKLRAHAVSASPFYARLHRGLEGRPLHELPVVTKAMLMESFDALVTDRAVRRADVERHVATAAAGERFADRFRVAVTSGSSGLKGLFLYDDDEWRTVLASYARATDWAGAPASLTRRTRMAVVSSRSPWHQSALVSATLANPLLPTLQLDATEPIAAMREELERFDPDLLVGYASMLRTLADQQLAGRLRLRPRAVMSASEVLTDETRRRVARAWGAAPYNVYAATETAGIASECAGHRSAHLYEDLVVTEVVDERGRAVPAGTYGARVLVTVLFTRTQPLIRYEMDDSVCLSTRVCPCGRPFALLDGVQGREEETLVRRSIDGAEARVHPKLFHDVLEPLPLDGWQLEERDDGLHLRVAGGDLTAESLGARVTTALRHAGVAPPPVLVERVDRLPRAPGQKLIAVRRLHPGAPYAR